MLHSWLPRSFHCDKMKSIGIMNVRIAYWQHLRICSICPIHRLLPKRMNFFLYSGSLISVTVGFKSTSRGLSITPFDTCNGILVIANRTIALQNEWNQKPTWSWCNMLHIYFVFVCASTYWHRHPHSFQRQHPTSTDGTWIYVSYSNESPI